MRKSDLNADDLDTFAHIKALLEHSEPERTLAMYSVSTGVVRELIALAVGESIASGNHALQVEFSGLDQVGPQNHATD